MIPPASQIPSKTCVSNTILNSYLTTRTQSKVSTKVEFHTPGAWIQEDLNKNLNSYLTTRAQSKVSTKVEIHTPGAWIREDLKKA